MRKLLTRLSLLTYGDGNEINETLSGLRTLYPGLYYFSAGCSRFEFDCLTNRIRKLSDLIQVAETSLHLQTVAGNLILPVPIVFLLPRVVDFDSSLEGLLTPFLIGNPAEARRMLHRLFVFRVGWHVLNLPHLSE